MQTDFGELNGNITANLELLRRCFDNLYANLVKYAEPSQPIRIRYGREGDQILLSIVNGISVQRDHRESTNIGLNTCRRILRMHDGTFDVSEKADVFSVEIRLPILDP